MNAANEMSISFSALSENEAFARVAVAAFVLPLNPTMEELTEVKTIVSEAVTNSIIHGYKELDGIIYLQCKILGDRMELVIEDHGVGIEDVDVVRQPLYTSRPDLERSGMGFTIMESFVDELEVDSAISRGTRLRFVKYIRTPQSAAHYEV